VFEIVLVQVCAFKLIGDLCLVVMDDNEDVVCINAPVPTNAQTPRPVARNGGTVRVRLMVKVQSPHLLPFAQENSRSTVSMYGRKNGSLSAAIRRRPRAT
jgi:hypothetical protein